MIKAIAEDGLSLSASELKVINLLLCHSDAHFSVATKIMIMIVVGKTLMVLL